MDLPQEKQGQNPGPEKQWDAIEGPTRWGSERRDIEESEKVPYKVYWPPLRMFESHVSGGTAP